MVSIAEATPLTYTRMTLTKVICVMFTTGKQKHSAQSKTSVQDAANAQQI
jgi:hypothetical protein